MLFPRKKAGLGAGAGAAAAEGGFTALDSRLPVAEGGSLLRKAFPEHWSYFLGELALYSLVVLVLTGSYLTLFFDPEMTEVRYTGSYEPLQGVLMSGAYASTLDISFDIRGGLLIRQIHHWAALVFVAAIGLHMLRVFFTGAFRKPREVNWVIGVTLFMLSVAEGFAGYSLPDDLLSGTGLRVVQSLLLSIPVAGTYLSFFLFGGEYPGTEIVPRLYTGHVLFVPALLIALVVVHLILVVYLKHTQWGGPGRTNRNVVGKPSFPQFATTSTGLALTVSGILTLLGGLTQINPVWNYGPYRPDQVSTASQPDWYIGFLEGALRLMPPFETTLWGHTFMWNVLVPTAILPGLLFLGLYLHPFLEKWVTGDSAEHHLCDRPRDRPTRTGLGAAGITFYAVLLMAGGNDVISLTLEISLNWLTWILRFSLVLLPVLVFVLTKRLCLGLQDHDTELLEKGEETGEVRQSVEGGLSEGEEPISREKRYTLLMNRQRTPVPLRPASPADGGLPTRRSRLRVALSRWFHRDRAR